MVSNGFEGGIERELESYALIELVYFLPFYFRRRPEVKRREIIVYEHLLRWTAIQSCGCYAGGARDGGRWPVYLSGRRAVLALE